MISFQPDEHLLNDHFEAYRLIPIHPQSTTTAYHLPSGCSLVNLNSLTNALSPGYKELKDRLLRPKLIPGSLHGHVAYIDDGGFVILVVLSRESQRPSFHPLISLSSVQGESSYGLSSLHSLPDGKWLAADGCANIILFATSLQGRRWTGVPLQSYKILSTHFRILSCMIDSYGDIHVLLQYIRKETATTSSGESQRIQPSRRTVFDVSLVVLPAAQGQAISEEKTSDTDVKWTVTGDEAAYYANLGSDGVATLIAEEPFTDQHLSQLQTKNSDLPAIVSHSGKSPSNSHAIEAVSHSPKRAAFAHFSWLQTSDSLTVVFQLPHQLAKEDMIVQFSSKQVVLKLRVPVEVALELGNKRIVELGNKPNADEEPDEAHQAVLRTAQHIWNGRYRSRALWGPIDPSNSVWTWERVGNDNEKKVLLTLHLEKKDDGVRWPTVFQQSKKRRASAEATDLKSKRPMIGSVKGKIKRNESGSDEEDFASEGEQPDYDDDLDDPPEVVDPSDLITMIESLDKYTAPEGSGFNGAPEVRADGPQLGLGGRESLLHDQLEPEDAVVGKQLRLTTILAGSIENGRTIVNAHPDRSQLWTLATPLPEYRSVGNGSAGSANALVIRKDLDGLVFIPPAIPSAEGNSGSPDEARLWKHVDTLPALSYVLASKRDLNKVYVRHRTRHRLGVFTPAEDSGSDGRKYDSLVLAFESPPATEGRTSSDHAGNLFVYYGQTLSRGDGEEVVASQGKYAGSRVIRLDAEAEGDADSDTGGSGALMGVAAVHVEGGEEVLVCLCERRLIVLRGVL